MLNAKIPELKEIGGTVVKKDLPDQGGTLCMRKKVEYDVDGDGAKETVWRKCMICMDGGRYKTEVR